MQVFLSWSGARSKAVAETFAGWIAQVIQAVEPWISSDIEKGTRWSPEVAARLEQSKVGIICLTKENLDARWILFEAGALSKTKDAHVCTLLLDMTAGEVEQPLGQFQHTVSTEKNDVRQLVRTINRAVHKSGGKSLSDTTLDDVFETYWDRLATKFAEIAAATPPSGPQLRPEREILEEILQTVRNQERRLATVTMRASRLRDLMVHGFRTPAEGVVFDRRMYDELLRRGLLGKLPPPHEEKPPADVPPTEPEIT